MALGGLFSLGVGGTPLLPWSTLGCLEPSWLQMGAPAPHLTGYLVFGSLSSASIWFFGVQGLAPSHRMARGSQCTSICVLVTCHLICAPKDKGTVKTF